MLDDFDREYLENVRVQNTVLFCLKIGRYYGPFCTHNTAEQKE
jgi:hypothetical protein